MLKVGQERSVDADLRRGKESQPWKVSAGCRGRRVRAMMTLAQYPHSVDTPVTITTTPHWYRVLYLLNYGVTYMSFLVTL